jgi:hypothetical protein
MQANVLLLVTIALVCAAAIQWTVSILRYVWENPKHRIVRCLVVALSIFFALANGISIFKPLGVTFDFPWLKLIWLPLFGDIFGMVLTGLFLSRGVNFLYDKLKELFGMKKRAEELIQPPLTPPV